MELRNVAAKLATLEQHEQRITELEMIVLELLAGVAPQTPEAETNPEPLQAEGLTFEQQTTPRPYSAPWVPALHKAIIELATRPTRQGTNAGNPRKYSMSDGKYVYLPLHDHDVAIQPVARKYELTFRDIHAMRKPENAHPLITWMQGPNPNPREERTDVNKSQWVRVEIHGPAEKLITPYGAAQMFKEKLA